MTTPTLLTTAQVAAMCDVTRPTILRWVRNGTLAAWDSNGPKGGLRFDRAEVDALLARYGDDDL